MSESPSPPPPRELSPNRQRWRRFLTHKRGSWSLRILIALYATSLLSELISNDRPLLLRHRGRTFVPVLRSYTQDQVMGNGIQTRMTDYKSLWRSPDFATNRSDWVMRPLIPSGPHENLRQADFEPLRRLTVIARPVLQVARIQLSADGLVTWAEGDVEHFFPGVPDAAALTGNRLDEYWPLSEAMKAAIRKRLESSHAPSADTIQPHATHEFLQAKIRLAPFVPRDSAVTSVRLLFRTPEEISGRTVRFQRDGIAGSFDGWAEMPEGKAVRLEEAARTAFGEFVPAIEIPWGETVAEVHFDLEPISWPFRPVPGHWCGVDMAGRDVLARLLYGLRTSMTFGLLLVLTSLCIGILAGSIQGYFVGWTDILGQRMTEIWSALPFLYVMILLGNSFGRSFGLLLACYAAFNWIGVSTYVRAEYLRLRVRAFVDAARSQGLRSPRIMLHHILPNALTPIITLFPFELVGAVGALAALDYLGFGLPDGTPSLGELLRQAQLVRNAWWLILYPSLALFTVMILGVFVGEGLREAFDPKPYSKME